jgi:hypothetical protein
MDDINEQIEQRLKKLNELKLAGIEPFGGHFEVTHHASEILNTYGETSKEVLETQPVTFVIAGRIVAMRDFGKAAFAHIQDSSGRIQVYFRKDILGDAFSIVKKLDIGDIVGIKGKLFRTKTNELTVDALSQKSSDNFLKNGRPQTCGSAYGSHRGKIKTNAVIKRLGFFRGKGVHRWRLDDAPIPGRRCKTFAEHHSARTSTLFGMRNT